MSSAPGYPSTVGRVLARSATRLSGKLALTFAGWVGVVNHPSPGPRRVPRGAASGKLLKRELRDQLSAPAAASPS